MAGILARAILLALVQIAPVAAAAVSATDDRGTVVALDRPAARILAISPHLVELTYAAGAGGKLVAGVRGSDYPPAAVSLPNVGDASGLDHERIMQYAPDLVLAWGGGNRSADLARLARQRIPVFVATTRTFGDIARQLRAIGTLAGTTDIAESAALDFERRLQALRERNAGRTALAVFVEIWQRPLFTVSGRHFMSEALSVCGARNAFADYPLPAGPIPLENVLAADPQAIVSVAAPGSTKAHENWSRFPRLRAVRSAALIDISADLLTRPTPRILDGAQQLCERLGALSAY